MRSGGDPLDIGKIEMAVTCGEAAPTHFFLEKIRETGARIIAKPRNKGAIRASLEPFRNHSRCALEWGPVLVGERLGARRIVGATARSALGGMKTPAQATVF